MLINFLLGIKVFLFTFAILIVLRDLFRLLKVLKLKEGKYDASAKNLILLASSISYITAVLAVGF